MELLSIEFVVNNSIFFYGLLLIFSFIIFIIISSVDTKLYLKRNKYVTEKELLVSPHAPSVSIVISVFNLEDSIIDKVRALFALQYNNFDIIVVNNGSTDATFPRLKEFYQLEAVEYAVYEQLKSQGSHSYYKSANPAFSRLTVINKAGAGEAEALNAGINISEKELVLCIEEDCYIDQNSLLKLIRPFLEEDKQVIATGTGIHIANSCTTKNGHIKEVKLPRRILPAFQVIEYFKSFLIERFAWNHLNGLHIFNGAMGLFDKEILIQSGGYSSKTLQHGFDLIVRMCRYMYDTKQEYRVVYVSEPLCWVEVPDSLGRLSKQRKIRSRGSFETLWLHRDLFFNRKYGFLGLVNYPCWIFIEWITPYLKFLIMLILATILYLGSTNTEYVFILLSMFYIFAVMLSVIAFLFEEKLYRSYSSGRDVLRILILTFIEPVLYHPLTVYWKITSVFGKKSQ